MPSSERRLCDFFHRDVTVASAKKIDFLRTPLYTQSLLVATGILITAVHRDIVPINFANDFIVANNSARVRFLPSSGDLHSVINIDIRNHLLICHVVILLDVTCQFTARLYFYYTLI